MSLYFWKYKKWEESCWCSWTEVSIFTGQGASGGSDWEHNHLGGYSTVVRGIFNLSPGFLKIAIGQEGQCYKFDDLSGKKSKSVVCGGGGGTFVVSENEALLVAGGGGGAGDNGPGTWWCDELLYVVYLTITGFMKWTFWQRRDIRYILRLSAFGEFCQCDPNC